MSTSTDRARRLLTPVALLAVLAAPSHAQGTGATTGAQTTTTGMQGSTTTDMMATPSEPKEDRDFPWGLLGLLGLAGLLKRPKEDVVVRDTTTTSRPGDPNYRV